MLPLMAYIGGAGIGTILIWFVGAVIAFAIVFGILRALESPPLAYKIFYVVAGVIALLIVIDIFFNGGGYIGGGHDVRIP